ncbi:hypothetical protein PM082_015149 [Marasmius tenuissimus]|nr:hypothetical protein PM082_015149 [Marasmius tenuissimus]
MIVTLLQKMLLYLKRALLRNPLLTACRRLIWLLWSFITRQIRKARKGLKKDRDVRTDRDRERGESLGLRSNTQPDLDPILSLSSLSSGIICASETPYGLHPYAYNNPQATISSHELGPSTSTTFHDKFDDKNTSYPRISHPTTSGQALGTVNKATASSAASVSRLSVSESQHRGREETASRVSSAASHGSSSLQPAVAEVTRDESPLGSRHGSRLSLAADAKPLEEDQVSVLDSHESISGYDTIKPIERVSVGDLEGTTMGQRKLYFETKNLSEVYSDFFPMAPEIYYRYYKDDYIEPLSTTFELAPMTTRFQTKHLAKGWREFLHPEGARYFLYEPKRIYTDADIYNPNILRHAVRLINEFDEYTRTRDIALPNTMNLTLDMFYEEEDDSCPCRYYIADHASRAVFWLDKFDAEQMDVWSEVTGVTEMTHIRHAIEAQYWYHCQLFPDSYKLELTAVDELRDILIYWMGDILTSISSTIPYAIEELQLMLTLTNNLRKNVESWRGVAAFARIMHIFARQRFLDFHGQAAVRLDRNKSIHRPTDQSQPRSWLLGCLSPVMFSAPDTHLRELGKIWVDRCIHKAAWNMFISNMNSEWRELILFAIVLLNANVAFLTIQSVDEATNNANRSPAQVLSFLSAGMSIGSIINGLMLTRTNKVKHKEGATDAAIFLNSFDAERLGLETLATLYSAPYALFMWGVLFFLAAFSFFCLNDAALSVRLIVSGAWIVIAFLVVWCIFTLSSWDSRFSAQNRSAWDRVIVAIKNTFKKTVDAMKNKMIAMRIREPEPETPVRRLRSSPVRRISEMWRKASRGATIFSAVSTLVSGSRGGSRRVTEEVEIRSVAEAA